MAENTAPVILVVEDEPAQLELLSYNLTKEGYEVVRAEDGEAAMLLADEVEPDLILLDWMLPDTSGIEVCRQLKRQKRTASTPVMMLTARGEEEDRIRGLDTGKFIKLGPTEFRLLVTLLEMPGRVWSRDQLLDRVWGRTADVDLRTVDVHVGRLRKALREHDKRDPIRTVRGFGYALDQD